MFIPLAGKMVGTLIAQGQVKSGAQALELGSQTYSVGPEAIRSIRKELEEKGLPETSNALVPFETISPARKPKDPTPHMRAFFEALGFSKYQSIDIGNYGDNLVMDLNEDITKAYNFAETYDLVTNIGVSEHLINQASFFKNMHAVTKKGGYMLHIVPSLGFHNHGFFNYQPRFFQDLAAANGYRLIELFLAERDQKILDLLTPTKFGTSFYFASHVLTRSAHSNILVAALMQKETDVAFTMPLQGKYVIDIPSAAEKERYHASAIPERVIVPTKGYFSSPKTSRLAALVTRMQSGTFNVLRKVQRAVLSW